MDAAAPRDDVLSETTRVPAPPPPSVTVQRSLDVDTTPLELWQMITDPAELATWLATDVELVVAPGGGGRLTDDDGVVRHTVVEAVEPGRRLVLRWWRDGEGPKNASVVTMAVSPHDGGARLVVTEQLLAPPSSRPAAGASVRATAGAALSAWQWRLDLLLLRVAAATEAAAPRG